MSRKFSLAYLTIPGTAPVDQIRIAKEAGYDFVSLRTIPMHLPGEPEFLLHKDAKLFEETRQALKEYDMPVMDIELARTDPKYFNFIHLCDGPAGPDGDPVLDNIKDELMLFTAREGRLYPGEGAMDIAGMVKGMPEIPLSIELPNLKRIEELGVAGHAKRCLDTAKAYFKEHGID